MASTTHPAVSSLHSAFCGLAAVCDGAQSKDGQGFDGTDTHFGRRVALIHADALSADVIAEMARILPKYRGQVGGDKVDRILATLPAEYLGVDVRTEARDTARQAERCVKAKAKRNVTVVGGILVIDMGGYDPTLLQGFKALGSGARWDGAAKTWNLSQARITHDLVSWLLANGFRGADNLAPSRTAAAPVVHVTAKGERLVWSFPFNLQTKDAVKGLQGSRFVSANKTWETDIVPAAVEVAKAHGLTLAPEVTTALTSTTIDAKVTRKDVLRQASRMANPADLPDAFIALIPKGILA